MLSTLWFTFLYQPVFNALIWLYSSVANQNLGWAVVWLTIFLRVLLLPLTIISLYNVRREEKAGEEAVKVAQSFKNDSVARKEEVRKVMRRHHISPWAKVLSLGIQLVVLILLYQVFIRGISGDKVVKILYAGIDYPGRINTDFYGFDIGHVHDAFWAGVVAIYLFIGIFLGNKGRKWEASRATFLFLFPLFTFGALWILPMVKSLFILTSMVFSDIISLLRKVLFPAKNKMRI